MALHPRLGAASPARHCPSELLGRIMQIKRLTEQKHLAMIRVRSGSYVDRIELHFSDDSVVECGGRGGTWNEPFTLQPGESIVNLKVRQGDALDSIQFLTSRGRESPKYGGDGGTEWVFPFPDAGFISYSTLDLERLLFRRNEGWLAPMLHSNSKWAKPPSSEDEAALGSLFSSTFAKIHARDATVPMNTFGRLVVDELPPAGFFHEFSDEYSDDDFYDEADEPGWDEYGW